MLFFNICKIMCLKLPLEEEMLNSADAVASDILFGGGWNQIQRISLGV